MRLLGFDPGGLNRLGCRRQHVLGFRLGADSLPTHDRAIMPNGIGTLAAALASLASTGTAMLRAVKPGKQAMPQLGGTTTLADPMTAVVARITLIWWITQPRAPVDLTTP